MARAITRRDGQIFRYRRLNERYWTRREGLAGGLLFLLALGFEFFGSLLLPKPSAPARAERVARPDAAPLPAVQPADEQGAILTFPGTMAADAGNAAPKKDGVAFADARIARLIALDVPEGEAASIFGAPGTTTARFEGDIRQRLRDTITFSAEGRGHLILSINNAVALDVDGADLSGKAGKPVRLNKGKNHFVATYSGPASGEASFRLLWSSRNFAPEPVPPDVLSHDAADSLLRQSLRIREGRALIAALRCVKCHAFDDEAKDKNQSAMPDLAMDAPALSGIVGRLKASWMAAWISDPRALRPSAQMPRFADLTPVDARDIASYLATLGTPVDARPDAKRVVAGGRLFAELDCVACHVSPERADAADPKAAGVEPTPPASAPAEQTAQDAADASPAARIALREVSAKFHPDALVRYLIDPSSHSPATRMPNFRLDEEEATDLAAYLLSQPARDIPTRDLPAIANGDVARGRALLATTGCLKCHAIDAARLSDAQQPAFPALAKISATGWALGCMGITPAQRGHAPDFALNPRQREAILAFAATDLKSLGHESAPEFAQRQFAELRCGACHARDGVESALATSLEGESRQLLEKFPSRAPAAPGAVLSADQLPPTLTWAGEKLRPNWMASFIAGEIKDKPRYYLRARMPGFGPRSALIARGFSQEHGFSPADVPPSGADEKLAQIGRGLVGKAPNLSFGCVLCHAVKDQPPQAPADAPAINFAIVADRLRHPYYQRWMRDPLRIDPASKMPRFGDADDKTGIGAVLDGDATRQFDAIWNYLLLGPKMQPPAE